MLLAEYDYETDIAVQRALNGKSPLLTVRAKKRFKRQKTYSV